MQDNRDPVVTVSAERVAELLAKLRVVRIGPPQELARTPAHDQDVRELADVQGELLINSVA